MEIERAIGQRVKLARQAKGLSLTEFGKLVGEQLATAPWSRQTVLLAERGARDFKISDLAAVARALGVPVPWLLHTPADEPIQIGRTRHGGGVTVPASEAAELFATPSQTYSAKNVAALAHAVTTMGTLTGNAREILKLMSDEVVGADGQLLGVIDRGETR
jgi:transcriptional regulator with XRE-family HTH domain